MNIGQRIATFIMMFIVSPLFLCCSQQETPDDIDTLIKKLGDPNFKVREEATKAIEKYGEAVLERLENTRKTSPDLEIANRAAILISEIKKRRELFFTVFKDEIVLCAAFTPDNKYLACGTNKGAFYLVDLQTKNSRCLLKGQSPHQASKDIRAIAFSMDGKTAITGGHDDLRVWKMETATQEASLPNLFKPIKALSLSPDGSKAFIWDDMTLWAVELKTQNLKTQDRIWNAWWELAEGKRPKVEGTKGQFSNDHNSLITVNKKELNLWSVSDGTLKATFKAHSDDVHDASFFQNRNRVVSVSIDGTARHWDVKTKKELACFQTSLKGFRNIKPMFDGKKALIVADDSSVYLWDFETGKNKLIFEGNFGEILDADVSSDGKRVVYYNHDASLRVLALPE